MSVGTTNINGSSGEMYEKPYGAYHEQSVPPAWFKSLPPTYSGPTLIVFPGTLNMVERAQVNAWLVAQESQRPDILRRCTSRVAIAKITEYIAYYATASYQAWYGAAESSRIAQWRLYLATAVVNNKATVSKSEDTAGTGSGPVSVPFGSPANLPD